MTDQISRLENVMHRWMKLIWFSIFQPCGLVRRFPGLAFLALLFVVLW